MRIASNGTELAVTVTGSGPPVVLLHGWPHTRRVWEQVLLPGRRVIAPDLRGVGESAPASDGFDAATQAADVLGVLDALGVGAVEVAAVDAGVPVAFLLAMGHPWRVRRLVLMEGTLPGLPGGFDVPPWWFGFHAVPGLAEAVVEGREDVYLGWFLRAVEDPALRAAFVAGYRGRLAAGFGFYRAMEENASLIRAAVAADRLRMPVVALGGSVVGSRLHRQLEPHADDLTGEILERCGHIVPLDRPDALTRILVNHDR
ncbi:alpha/beta fold hydrolase [Actinoplanes sp. NBRC 103695]|uniref:alpha/beta fold hydrolase n=1 Tax=Actinoplanes sp. NBRC 103695 TaxID=3032202 RepID=UPI0024A3E9E5|nr:alpha/beta fold hydrolase [Actinoplanes sp. NBRC 103695]GLY98736.1 hydrolase [Actinoplanes sp. NBRC 103695]